MILLTVCSQSPGTDRWVRTAPKSGATPVILMHHPYFPVPGNIVVRYIDSPYPGNLRRFLEVPPVVKALGKHRWYIWTDACDVVIQAALMNLDELPEEVRIVPCPEDITHEESCWKPLLMGEFATLRDKMIYNGGLFAIRGDAFIEFVEFLWESVMAAQEPVPGVIDQLLLNLFIQDRLEQMRLIPGLFLCLDATYVTRGWARGEPVVFNPEITRDERGFIHKSGQPYCIVHANGTTKSLL